MDAETFRRICMSFDAWVVGFGLSRVLIELHLAPSPWAYAVLALTIAIDVCLLYTFFTARAARRPPAPGVSRPQNFSVLGRAVGYVIAAAALATLLYVTVPGLRLLP